jgi:Domain of unknown function (DUF4390)
MSRLFAVSFFLLSILIPFRSEAQIISDPEVKLNGNDMYVTFSVKLDPKLIEQIKDGIDKELKIYIDLFRVWKIWPDEFVLGKFYTRTLRSDPIKEEHVATSFDGYTIIKRRFRSFESMLDWTLSVKDLKLTSTRELDPGLYFVRITIESKIRKLPPVLRDFLLFLSENEFRVKKDSAFFAIEGTK